MSQEYKPVQSRQEVARAELDAAGIHYSICDALERGEIKPEEWGDYEWNYKWYSKHYEAAWYIKHPETGEEVNRVRPKSNRLLSRKWLGAVVLAVLNIIAILGYDIEIEKMAVVDAVYTIWLLIEGIIDAIKKT